VLRTRVGYTGGTSTNPTYRNLDSHSEAIQIDYDPTLISYELLLEIFWDSHDPASRSWSRQYRKAVFYHNEKQKTAAEESHKQIASITGSKVMTDIEPFTGFYLAEDYHQKHRLRGQYALLREFEEIYPEIKGLISSKAAARVNGYLGGYGTCEQLNEEINGFGLSASSNKVLLDEVCLGNTERTCTYRGCNQE
jgi:methionine-S-sulfoxide reductase